MIRLREMKRLQRTKYILLIFLVSAFGAPPKHLHAHGSHVIKGDHVAFLKDVVKYAYQYDSKFHVGNAAVMGYLSQLIYLDSYSSEANDQNLQEEYEKKLQNIGFDVRKIGVKRGRSFGIDANYVVFSTDKAVFVVFRGTEQKIADYLTDAAAYRRKRPRAAGKVHAGFYDNVEKIYSNANSTVKNYMEGKNKKVYITGQSLGGALASMYAYRRAKDKKKVTAVYTLASPRVGDHDFAKDFKAKLQGRAYRVKYHESSKSKKRDHITELPHYDQRNNLLAKKVNPIGWYNHVGEYRRLGKKSGEYYYAKNNFNYDDKHNWGDITDGKFFDLDPLKFGEYHSPTHRYAIPMISAAQGNSQLRTLIKQRKNAGGNKGSTPDNSSLLKTKLVGPGVGKGKGKKYFNTQCKRSDHRVVGIETMSKNGVNRIRGLCSKAGKSGSWGSEKSSTNWTPILQLKGTPKLGSTSRDKKYCPEGKYVGGVKVTITKVPASDVGRPRPVLARLGVSCYTASKGRRLKETFSEFGIGTKKTKGYTPYVNCPKGGFSNGLHGNIDFHNVSAVGLTCNRPKG